MSVEYSVNSDSAAPKFPADKSKYLNWKRKIESFLKVRGLLKYIKENQLKNNENEDEDSSSKNDNDEIKKNNETIKKENDRVYNILIQSLTDDQMILLNDIEEGNAFELFKKLNDFYGAVKTTDTVISIMDQLSNNKKLRIESMKEYIERVSSLIHQLEEMSIKQDIKIKKYYIVSGLSKASEWASITELIGGLDKDSDWTITQM